MGAAPNDQFAEEQARLEALERERAGLAEDQEEVEAAQELEDLLAGLHELPPGDITIIINTGAMPNGEAVKTKSGRELDPEVAKKLAEAAESGETKLTKALLKGILGIAKGIIKAIFFIAGEALKAGANAVSGKK